MENKTVVVTRDFILSALDSSFANNTLKPECFIDPSSDIAYENCEVCAVGAIFRAALLPTEYRWDLLDHISEVVGPCTPESDVVYPDDFEEDEEAVSTYNFDEIHEEALGLLNEDKFLSALSVFFEGTSGDYQLTREFVASSFPDEIEIDINGFDLSPSLTGITLKTEPAPKVKKD